MEKFSKRIELFANLAIVVVAILLATVLIKRYLIQPSLELKKDSDLSAYKPSNHQRLNLEGVDWTKANKTLVLAISSTCHFCTESAGFYQQLIQARQGTQLLAVLPQPLSEGKRYVAGLGLKVDIVLQASLDSIDVAGTPTLLLVSKDGTVIDSWIGKLNANQENEVLSQTK